MEAAAMTADGEVALLYSNYELLANEPEPKNPAREKEYLEIVAAVKGSAKAKRLASQFIVRFFKHFPHLAERAIEAQLDLCEDDDVTIRKQAIRDLPALCRDSPAHTQKIADILAQLLQTYDPSELVIVHNAIFTLLKTDPKGTLSGLFSQIRQAQDNDSVRERCLKFLAAKVKTAGKEVITEDVEAYIVAECRKVLEDVNAEEFDQIMELLGGTRLGRTASGHREIVEMIAVQALTDGDGEFSVTEAEHVDRLIQCVGHALPYFSTAVPSTRFVEYFCDSVLPRLDDVASAPEGGDSKLEILKLFAELAANCGPLENPETKIETVYDRCIKYMPLPPAPAERLGEDDYPVLEFSPVECLLFSFHRLAGQAPEFIASDADRLREFRLRLQYFARLTQGYIKKLREATNGKPETNSESEENKIKLVALKTTSNINAIIKDLFRTPPSYKTVIHLSFQTRSRKMVPMAEVGSKTSPEVAGSKRHAPIVFDDKSEKPSDEKRTKSDHQKIYAPPSGKYSDKISNTESNYSNGNRWRRNSRGGGGRNFRNRGNNFRNGQFRRNRF